ncbi:MAG TPA: rhombosortase [Thiolapillus brandeum]|uniref:Rhombosortase n=1 Tax=Thiolapillus brandeum TaxID=1076588 RepID=A0A831WBU2_9GAMM|nr:rhombosortase [Thiolapillus brandeum]
MFAEHLEKLRHGGPWLPWRTLLLATAAVAAYLLLGAAPENWVFDRAAITRGEWWRLLSGHWVHSGAAHAGWDIGALLLLGFLFEKTLGRHLVSVLLLGSLGIDAWIWWGEPSLGYYCGLSGILNTLMAVGLVSLWQEMRHPLIALTGLGFVAKVLIELSGGQMLLTSTAWPGVPEVHAVGMFVGMLYTGTQLLTCRWNMRNESSDPGRDADRFLPGAGGKRTCAGCHTGIPGVR